MFATHRKPLILYHNAAIASTELSVFETEAYIRSPQCQLAHFSVEHFLQNNILDIIFPVTLARPINAKKAKLLQPKSQHLSLIL